MSTSEFPSNRHKDKKPEAPKPAEKKVTKVTENEVVRRKTPLGKRMAQTFIGGDASSVWEFVTFDVLVPAARDMVADAVTQGVERMIWGDSRSTSRRTGRHPASESRINYNKMSRGHRGGPPDERSRHEIGMSRRGRATHDFDEIILGTRHEAEEVLDRLFEIVAKYETATVADLYDLLGITGTYTDDKWGWADLRGTGVQRTRNGYLLDLPKPEPLD